MKINRLPLLLSSWAFLLTGLVLAAPPVLADTPIDQTRALAGDGTLSVSNVKGAVIIHTWDKSEVHITGTLGSNTPKLDISGDQSHLTIKVKNNGSGGGLFNWGRDSRMGPTRLELNVPRGINLDVTVVSARIKADGLKGGTLDLDTVSGNVEVQADSPAVKLNSVSGDIVLDGHAEDLDANTVSGDLRVRQVGSRASIQTVSGDIHLEGGTLQKASLDSVSGDIEVRAGLATDTTARLHSMSGDIRLGLRGKVQATFSAKTMSGDIRSVFGKVDSSTYGPGSSLHYATDDARGDVTLESLSGDIDIRKKD